MTDRHPNLVERLRGEIVKPECGEQADDPLGDLVSLISIQNTVSAPGCQAGTLSTTVKGTVGVAP